MSQQSIELSGKVIVLPVEWPGAADLAARLGARGATIVLVGPDGDVAGRMAAVLEAQGSGRPAVFVSDGSPDSVGALANFLSELFRPS